jgi:hypothetical protein
MRNTLFQVLLFLFLFQLNICLGGEWFYGTWYFDRDFTRNQLTNNIAKLSKPPLLNNIDWKAELLEFQDGIIGQLDGTVYTFATNYITLTIEGKAHKIPYSILSRPNTNQVILKYENGDTNSIQLMNGLLEVNAKGNLGLKIYYSREKK